MAELYIVDGFNDPIDISYYTEEEKEEFFKLSPSARKVDQQEVEPVEAKIKGSVAGAGALSKNVAPTTVSDLEIGSVDLQDNAKLKIDGTEYSVSSIKEKYGDINSYMKSFKDAGKGDEIEIIYPKAKTIKTISEQSNVKDYDKFVVPTTEEKDNIQLQVDDLSLAKVKTTSRIAEGGKTMQSFTTVVQPYEKEMNAAKAQLKKLNLPLTPENVEKYTRENIYKNKVFDLQKEKANEYFDDIDTGNAYQNKKYQRKLYDDIETRKVLNENKLENDSKILKKTVEYFKDPNTSRNKNLASFNDAITNPGDRFKDVPEDELVLLENGNKVPKKVFEKYQSLIGTAEMERDYLIKSVEQINETSKNFSQGFKDLDLVSRNYDLFEQVIATAANSISDATLSGFIAISDVAVALPVDIIKASDKKYSFKNPVEKFKNDLNYFRNKSNEELQKNYAYKPEFGSDINPFSKDGSWSNLGNFATLGLAGQTGTLYSYLWVVQVYMH